MPSGHLIRLSYYLNGYKIPNDNFEKAQSACKAFGCVPYFAVVVDGRDTIRGFILPMARLLESVASLLGIVIDRLNVLPYFPGPKLATEGSHVGTGRIPSGSY